jgi:hypothetical protein
MKNIKRCLLNMLSIKPIFNFFRKLTNAEVNKFVAYVLLFAWFILMLILITKNVA